MIERAARDSDLPGLVELWRRFETATTGSAESDEAEVRRDWDTPGFDRERSTRVVLDGERPVGYAVLDAEGGCDSVVDPDVAGGDVEDRLLDWLEARGDERGLALEHYWGQEDEAARARFAGRGWTPARTFRRMRLELDRPTPDPVWPDGVTVREVDPDRDGPVVHRVVQDAFADIGDGHGERPYDAWAASMLAPDRFVAAYALVAEDGGEVVGAVLGQAREDFVFVRQLAVPRAHRGRGIGLALLHESFRRHAAAGAVATVLGVDAGNATGATALYERAGMRVVEAFTRWERPPSAP